MQTIRAIDHKLRQLESQLGTSRDTAHYERLKAAIRALDIQRNRYAKQVNNQA
jgi:hypothetical protein